MFFLPHSAHTHVARRPPPAEAQHALAVSQKHPTFQTQKLTKLENTNLGAHNKYLILFPERHRAYMQFGNQERQLIFLCEIRTGHGMKDANRSVAVITESHNTRWQCLKY